MTDWITNFGDTGPSPDSPAQTVLKPQQSRGAVFVRRTDSSPAPSPLSRSALTAEFYEDMSTRRPRTAFIDRNRLYVEPRPLADVVSSVSLFVMPVLDSLPKQQSFAASWLAAGRWRERHEF